MVYMGLLAGILTGISFIPQSIKTIKTRDTTSISLFTYILFTCGVSLWIVYGFFAKDIAVFVTNLVTILPCSLILIIKIRESIK
ncbi:SemiSWEET transporter [Enterococcus sp. CU12B]|uniref:MtN3 and saliva related transmembrane protein n=1 Tax=Candidatus Enterococcus willemsii TaxID=1857215 RepID=A0ABQ6Z0V4_9ENTE|nr:hypothetical protein BAU17_13775 [Enterococcus sp. CU12B]